MKPVTYFLLFIKASLFSMGGLGNIASLQHDLLARHWAQNADFGEAIAIGQITPGPNGLWVISLGFLTYGWLGALLALAAVTVPPFLILPLNAIYHRIEHLAWTQALVRSLSLVSVGFLLSSAWTIEAGYSNHWTSILICLAACGLCLSRKVPTFLLLVAAAVVGYVLYGLL